MYKNLPHYLKWLSNWCCCLFQSVLWEASLMRHFIPLLLYYLSLNRFLTRDHQIYSSYIMRTRFLFSVWSTLTHCYWILNNYDWNCYYLYESLTLMVPFGFLKEALFLANFIMLINYATNNFPFCLPFNHLLCFCWVKTIQ